jgi:hypothetical protein
MMTRRIIFIGFISMLSMAACTQKLKPTSVSEPVVQVKEVVDEGIIIKPTDTSDIDSVKKSLKANASGMIGTALVKVLYHSPAVRGRVIWGGLVPYDQVWVTGAHMATAIVIDKSLIIGNKKIEAGKYALFTFPGKDEWIVTINTNWEQHLADEYSANDDLVRISIKPEMTNTVQERLMYQVVSSNEQAGNIVFSWEKIKLNIPLQVVK